MHCGTRAPQTARTLGATWSASEMMHEKLPTSPSLLNDRLCSASRSNRSLKVGPDGCFVRIVATTVSVVVFTLVETVVSTTEAV